MSTNEQSLETDRKINPPVDKILGLTGIVGAPMLLLQFLFGGASANSGVSNYSPAISALGVLYIGGWICGAVWMFRHKVYGENLAAKIIFTLQMIFLTLAFLFSIQETLGFSYENGGGKFFFVCDMGYPASHLFMIVVGIFVARAKRWKGLSKFAPFLVGSALPLTIAAGNFVGMSGGMLLFGGLTTIGLGTIGWKIFKS